jgi:hypothetical protein
VKKFAPVLAFDRNADTFPIDAQKYFKALLCDGTDDDGHEIGTRGFDTDDCSARPEYSSKSRWPFSRDAKDLRRNRVPTYYKVNECGPDGQLRIEYWWFYPWQPTCDGVSGSHRADWEHVIVIPSMDRAEIAAVIYFQHAGWYTRTFRHGHVDAGVGQPLDFWTLDGHPVVYVGRTQHGSYHDTKKVGAQTCTYFGDMRNPGTRANWYWRTWETPLYNLEPTGGAFQQPWMQHDFRGKWAWSDKVATHPTTKHRGNSVCKIRPCEGMLPAEPLTGAWGTAGCMHSSCMLGGNSSHCDHGLLCRYAKGSCKGLAGNTYKKNEWLFVKTGLPHSDQFMICKESNCRCPRRRADASLCR